MIAVRSRRVRHHISVCIKIIAFCNAVLVSVNPLPAVGWVTALILFPPPAVLILLPGSRKCRKTAAHCHQHRESKNSACAFPPVFHMHFLIPPLYSYFYCSCSVSSHLQKSSLDFPFGCMTGYKQKSIPDRSLPVGFLPSGLCLITVSAASSQTC